MLLVNFSLASLGFFSSQQNSLHDTLIMAHILGENSSAALAFEDQKAAQKLLQSLHFNPSIIQAAFYLPSGQLIAAYDKNTGISITTGAPVKSPHLATASTLSWQYLEVFEPIPLPNQSTGLIYLKVSLNALYQRLLGFMGVVILIVLAALLAALSLMDRLQQVITRPLLELTELMHKVSEQHDYQLRADSNRHDEIGQLAHGFNLMLGFVERCEAGLKRKLREHENSNRHLNQLAHYDALTGLPNRYYFNEHLEFIVKSTLARQDRAGLMFIDLDGFKPINDTLGHRMGDQLLRSVARRLTACLRTGDTVCRIGGDEFAILLENLTDPQHAGIIAEKIIQALDEPFKLESHEVHTRASIGISLCPDTATESALLLHYADTAMYQAKRNGKGRYEYFQP
ncbi:MAG TPA: diguanylate cyclase [Candidatus Competibacteraceae bacterium]|mgnify:FL=1|nr:diguanylate cyclase [Candidatus Competibacteraceae bacterium]MCP5133380.1 diguanylate cyclase [Gammaproteobacteria bacterium]HPF57228.1 diguanylate cyclase [Candidatus Competibacteraceae bacterium]HRY18146.1 diguanylate cyclase [Candidatus Competibacteraceae bacterium]